jgi:hypothetical protein
LRRLLDGAEVETGSASTPSGSSRLRRLLDGAEVETKDGVRGTVELFRLRRLLDGAEVETAQAPEGTPPR